MKTPFPLPVPISYTRLTPECGLHLWIAREEHAMRTNIQCSLQKFAGFTLLLFSGLSAAGQRAFENLGFEDTTITPILVNPLSGTYWYIATLPGWTWSPFSNPLNADPTKVPCTD